MRGKKIINSGIIKPVTTPIEDISYLLNNVTTNLYIKLESMQITKTHKYRLMYGLINKFLETHKMKDFTGFVEASNANAALSLAEISNQISKQVILFLPANTDVHIKNKIKKYNNVVIKECYDIEDAYMSAKDYANRYRDYIYLDQYNNFDSISEYELLAEEILEQISNVDILITTVDTGAMISGLSNIFNCYTCGVTINDNYTSIPEITNFKLVSPKQIIISTNERNLINTWETLSVDEIIEYHAMLTKTLPNNFPVNINYATAANILTAVNFSNRNDYKTILTIDTGR